jgi:DNA-binding NarL/FixJ family response regulator
VAEGGSVTVALVDGLEPELRSRLAQALAAAGIDVVNADVAGHALEGPVVRRVPQVVILGEEAEYGLLYRLKSNMPGVGVIVVADEPSHLSGTTLLAAGAACLDRNTSIAELVVAIRLALGGTLLFVSANGRRIERHSASNPGTLTRREIQVFHQLSDGRSYAEVALDLQIGYETVRTHAGRICKKLSVKSRQELKGMSLPAEPDHGQY